MTDSPASSSQTAYRNKRLQLIEDMLLDLLRLNRAKKKELEAIPLPWFKWLAKSLRTREVQIPKEIKKSMGKPRKNELRYMAERGK
jgi:hypothetical protein